MKKLMLMFTLASVCACVDLPVESEMSSAVLAEADQVACDPTSSTFPCLSLFDTFAFNNRLPFCKGNYASAWSPQPANRWDNSGNTITGDLNGCVVGGGSSVTLCREVCGDGGGPFTSGCGYEYNPLDDTYVGRCFTSYSP